MIKIRIQGGLGNQMFQYAYGRKLSLEKAQDLVLDIQSYSRDDKRKFILDKYKIKAKIDNQTEKDCPTIEGFWQSEKYFSEISDLIRKELSLKENSIDQHPICKEIEETQSVSVHIRRTDYTTSKHKAIYDNLSVSYYLEAIRKIQEKLETEEIKLFIFSDDISWVKENIEPYITCQFDYVSNIGLTDIQEHFLMSICRHNIIANSTYSWWAAWLNPNPEKIIISPAKWFVDDRDEKELIPENWIKIPNDPKISVIMPVYKNGTYLKQAIDSIIQQTFDDFEFIIIEDKSDSYECKKIINSYNDHRIKYILNEEKKGIAQTLNQAIKISRGKFIARMDSDDISLPKRLEIQYKFLNENKEISMCGTNYTTIEDNGHKYRSKLLTKPEDIKAGLLFNSCVAHPSVMIKKEILTRNNLYYRPEFIEEDYDLWVRISEISKITNIKKSLFQYRIHNTSLMAQNRIDRKSTVIEIRKRQLEKLGLNPNEKQMGIHNSIICKDEKEVQNFLIEHSNWLQAIQKSNITAKIYDEQSLDKILYTRWYNTCGLNAKNYFKTYKMFISSRLFRWTKTKHCFDLLKIFIKSLLRF